MTAKYSLNTDHTTWHLLETKEYVYCLALVALSAVFNTIDHDKPLINLSDCLIFGVKHRI